MPTQKKKPAFNINRWGPLHNLRVHLYGRNAWKVDNYTSRERSPSVFETSEAAWAWVISITTPHKSELFAECVKQLRIIEQRDGVATSLYGNVRYKCRAGSTYKGASELKRLKEFGLVVCNHKKGGYKFWTLTAHGRAVLELAHHAHRIPQCQDTSLS